MLVEKLIFLFSRFAINLWLFPALKQIVQSIIATDYVLHPKYVSVRLDAARRGDMFGSITVEFHECTAYDLVYVGCVSSSYKDNITSCKRGNFLTKPPDYIPGTWIFIAVSVSQHLYGSCVMPRIKWFKSFYF